MRIRWNDSPAWSTAITTDGSPGKLIADFRKHIRNYWRCSRIEFSACTIKSLHIRLTLPPTICVTDTRFPKTVVFLF